MVPRVVTLCASISALLFLSSEVQTQAAEPSLVCPVMGNPVTMPTELIVQFNGVEFHLCCEGCDDKFVASPEHYIEEAASGPAAIGLFLFDPVSGNRVAISEAATTRVFQGVLYPFESKATADQFDRVPRNVATAVQREGVACPVMKTPIKNRALAIGFADHEGTRYYFCCAGCDTQFAENPSAFAKAVETVPSVARLEPVLGGGKGAGKKKLMPTCAGCAGEARMLSDGQLPTLWTSSFRLIGTPEKAARFRATLDYRATPRVSLGIERNGGQDGVSTWPSLTSDLGGHLGKSDGDTPLLPRATWFITPESQGLPSAVLGVTADRLSTPKGQAVFLTFAKDLENISVSPFASAKYSTATRRVAFPFGANVMVGREFALQAINDGDYTHLLLTHMGPKFSTSLILARTKWFGLGVSFGL